MDKEVAASGGYLELWDLGNMDSRKVDAILQRDRHDTGVL